LAASYTAIHYSTARGKLHGNSESGRKTQRDPTLSHTHSFDTNRSTQINEPKIDAQCFYSNDYVTNETKPAARNISEMSQELVREKRRNLGCTEPELSNHEPEKASEVGGSRKVSPTSGKGTSERGNSEIESQGSPNEHAQAHSKSERTSYTNKPHAKIYENESSDSENDDKKRKRIPAKHEDAIDGATSDTNDYNTSSLDDSSSEEGATKLL
jgi:hypothetical protein